MKSFKSNYDHQLTCSHRNYTNGFAIAICDRNDLCPEFVIELRSQSDRLQVLQDKMQEYIDSGTQLGWLIDRKQPQVFIYHPNSVVEELNNPKTLCGELLLPGFILDLSQVW